MRLFPQWLRNGTLLAVTATLGLAIVGTIRSDHFWVTPDQRGQQLERRRQFENAARAYADSTRQGVALYRAGNFQSAAAALGRGGGAVGAYNQGTALLMHGAYDAAIDSFDRALSLQPGWPPAVANRSLAVARKAMLQSKHADDESSDEKPDDIVFDKSKNQNPATVQLNSNEAMSDEAMRAQWLRRVQTRPADFLKAKFAYEAQTPKDASK